MNKPRLSILAPTLVVFLMQFPGQAQAAEPSPLAPGSTIPVMLEKAVDARKNKTGDEVTARTTEHVKANGRVVIPRGSKIVGHVTLTEAKANTKDASQSLVGIAFDRVVLKDGHEIPLALEIQAIAPAAETTPSEMASPGAAGGTGTSPMTGQTNASAVDPNAGTPGRIASPMNGADASYAGLTASGGLTPQCHGVLGIDGLVLSPGTADSAQGSVIASQRRNVRLDGRTQMMLRVKGT
jgi:hypothetical protein